MCIHRIYKRNIYPQQDMKNVSCPQTYMLTHTHTYIAQTYKILKLRHTLISWDVVLIFISLYLEINKMCSRENSLVYKPKSYSAFEVQSFVPNVHIVIWSGRWLYKHTTNYLKQIINFLICIYRMEKTIWKLCHIMPNDNVCNSGGFNNCVKVSCLYFR